MRALTRVKTLQQLLPWLSRNAAGFQALSAILVAIFTLALVVITRRYARIAERSLKLAKQQYEREWSPDVRVQVLESDTRKDIYPQLVVSNLSRAAALVHTLRFTRVRGANADTQGVQAFPVNELLPGAGSVTVNIFLKLQAYVFGTHATEEDLMAVSAGYYCSGKDLTTDWADFVISSGPPLNIKPTNKTLHKLRSK